MLAPNLATIPVVDVGAAGLARYALDAAQRARGLRDDCIEWMPAAGKFMLPAMDALTRRWLRRSPSRYCDEVEAIANGLGFSGIWFLNGSYQWGCTALAREVGEAPWLVRTLDWPFPGMGRRVEVARMRGPAGNFDSVTWPGFVGVLTANAHGRFAAAINQAPLWRRTRRPWLRPLDIILNARRTWGVRAVPPDHLLREVFETCSDFDTARRQLETSPIARPTIYTLVGCKSGERCIIERTPDAYDSRADDTATANDWGRPRAPWEARMQTSVLLTRSTEEAARRSRERHDQLAGWGGSFGSGSFAWLSPPVLNSCTRLAVEMCPERGHLRLVGYEKATGADLPAPVTQICELEAAAA